MIVGNAHALVSVRLKFSGQRDAVNVNGSSSLMSSLVRFKVVTFPSVPRQVTVSMIK